MDEAPSVSLLRAVVWVSISFELVLCVLTAQLLSRKGRKSRAGPAASVHRNRHPRWSPELLLSLSSLRVTQDTAAITADPALPTPTVFPLSVHRVSSAPPGAQGWSFYPGCTDRGELGGSQTPRWLGRIKPSVAFLHCGTDAAGHALAQWCAAAALCPHISLSTVPL